MGYEIPGGIGVKLAEPERDVVVMIGDGTYLMMNFRDRHGRCGRFETHHRSDRQPRLPMHPGPATHLWGIGFWQRVAVPRPEERYADRRLRSDRFKKHAEAMGAHAVLAQTAAEVTSAVQEARQREGVSVVVVPVDPEKRMPSLGTWWDVPVAEVSTVKRRARPAKTTRRPPKSSARCSHETCHRAG